ncbi:MAG: hypothetical protein ACD_43C00206G0002 [uncultured bacterium]|nr:MAG: hypothetical protein ACD_43C00206G0002 [uncultured bacterium]
MQQPTLDLVIKNLFVRVADKEILHGISLTIKAGEIHAIMGPNGSGKTTLSQAIMGHPKYLVTGGEIWFQGQDITKLTPDKRAHLGLFLAFQNPREIPGVRLATFLRMIYAAKTGKKLTVAKFKQLLDIKMTELQIDPSLAERYLHADFSGGEKKKSEALQLALLEPALAVLDETDSGLDIDALRLVCSAIVTVQKKTNMGVLMITHYNRILDYIVPNYVHVLMDGKIVRSGGKEFAQEVEAKGYGWL